MDADHHLARPVSDSFDTVQGEIHDHLLQLGTVGLDGG